MLNRLVFSKELITNSEHVKAAYKQLQAQRISFNVNQFDIKTRHAGSVQTNQAAQISKDYWREIDAITARVFRADGGLDLLSDLMGISASISIGKTAVLYRVSSDAGKVTRSISGQVPEDLDKVVYDHYGDPIPIFSTGYAREWREWQGMSTENLDALSDDQEAHSFAIRRDMALYLLSGDSGINVRSYSGKGIRNHQATKQISLDAGGANIDLQSATSDQIMNFFTKDFAKILDDNYCMEKVKLWVSPSIRRRISQPFSNSDGFKAGTLEQYILDYGRIESINSTFELSGNNFIAYVRNPMYIKPRVAAPVSTFAEPRNNPFDNYNFMIWAAFGLQIKKDSNGRSKVFNAVGSQAVI